MKKLLLSVFIVFGLTSCSLNNDTNNDVCGDDVTVAFTQFPLACNYTLKEQPNNPSALVITSQEKMDTYFTKHDNTCPDVSDPNIDFTKNYLLGVFSGAKPTSGYSIKVESVIENYCEVVVNISEKSPDTGAFDVPTYPSDYVLIPKTDKPIYFNKVPAPTM